MAFMQGMWVHKTKGSQQSRGDAAIKRYQSQRRFALTSDMWAQSSTGGRGGVKDSSHADTLPNCVYICTDYGIQAQLWHSSFRSTGILLRSHCVTLVCLHSVEFGNLGNMSRERGIPRRGGRSGVRVSSVRGCVQPVSPIREEPPSPESDDSEQECLLPEGTYQSFRFRFPSRLVRPEVVVNFLVFFTEEDPCAPSRARDNDIFVGDVFGTVFRTRREETIPAPGTIAQPVEPREDSGNDLSIQEIMHLPDLNAEVVDPAAQAPMDPEDGLVIWIDSPSQGEGEQADSTSQHG